jgi:hypothetical protein
VSKIIRIRIFDTQILPAVLYGCETWSQTLYEEHRLRVFESMVLWRIFQHKRDEVTGGWRNLCKKELHDLYSSRSIFRMITSRRTTRAGDVARMEKKKKNASKILVGKPKKKRPLGKPSYR